MVSIYIDGGTPFSQKLTIKSHNILINLKSILLSKGSQSEKATSSTILQRNFRKDKIIE